MRDSSDFDSLVGGILVIVSLAVTITILIYKLKEML